MKVTRFQTVLILGMLCMCTPSAYATVAFKNYQELKENTLFQTYIEGVGVGYVIANSVLRVSRHQDPLFCTPSKLALTQKNYLTILDNYISKHDVKGEHGEDRPVEVLLLIALRDVFPCKKTNLDE